MKNLFKILFSPRFQYMTIMGKEQEEKDKSVRLGVQGLILAIVGIVGTIAFVVIGNLCAQSFQAATAGGGVNNLPIMSLFGAIVFYAFALVFFLACSLPGVSFAVYQKKLNNRAFGKVTLIVNIILLLVTLITSIVLLFVML